MKKGSFSFFDKNEAAKFPSLPSRRKELDGADDIPALP
jgi:hypothetical protein